MAFGLTRLRAYGIKGESATYKRSLQVVNMEITGTASDVDLDIGDDSGTFWTAVGKTGSGYKALIDIINRSTCLSSFYCSELIGKPINNGLVALLSDAGSGGSATESMTVTGLLTTDQIVAVTQQTKGANGTALIAYDKPADAADDLDVEYTGDPGAGSIIQVLVQREGAAPIAGGASVAIQNDRPNITLPAGEGETSYNITLFYQLRDEETPIEDVFES